MIGKPLQVYETPEITVTFNPTRCPSGALRWYPTERREQNGQD